MVAPVTIHMAVLAAICFTFLVSLYEYGGNAWKMCLSILHLNGDDGGVCTFYIFLILTGTTTNLLPHFCLNPAELCASHLTYLKDALWLSRVEWKILLLTVLLLLLILIFFYVLIFNSPSHNVLLSFSCMHWRTSCWTELDSSLSFFINRSNLEVDIRIMDAPFGPTMKLLPALIVGWALVVFSVDLLFFLVFLWRYVSNILANCTSPNTILLTYSGSPSEIIWSELPMLLAASTLLLFLLLPVLLREAVAVGMAASPE